MNNNNNKTTSANETNIYSKGSISNSSNAETSKTSSKTTDCCDKVQNCGKNAFLPDGTERRDGPGGE